MGLIEGVFLTMATCTGYRISRLIGLLFILSITISTIPLIAQTNSTPVSTSSENSHQNESLAFKELAPGVKLASCELPADTIFYRVMKIDLTDKNVKLGVIRPPPSDRDGKANVSVMAEHATNETAEPVAVVNGDYYDHGVIGPWGIHMHNGSMLFSPAGKVALLIDSNGLATIDIPTFEMSIRFGEDSELHKILDLNRPDNIGDRKGFHLFASSRIFNDVDVLGGAAFIRANLPSVTTTVTGAISRVATREQNLLNIPEEGLILTYNGSDQTLLSRVLQTGTTVRIETTVSPSCVEGIGGGPTIVKNGQIAIGYEAESFSQGHASYLKGRHPRTAAGLTKDRKTLLIVLVEGRTKRSKGMHPEETAKLMLDLGSWDAMMFDGGASSTLHTKESIVTSDVKERNICNGLAIFTTQPATK